jgi:hypothetical protein
VRLDHDEQGEPAVGRGSRRLVDEPLHGAQGFHLGADPDANQHGAEKRDPMIPILLQRTQGERRWGCGNGVRGGSAARKLAHLASNGSGSRD